MKKVVFVIIISFALFVGSNPILASTDSEYATALKYYNSGQYEEAARLLKEYVKKNPDPSAYYRLGYSLYELGKYDEANEYFQEAYLINPEISPATIEFLQKYQRAKTSEFTKTTAEQVTPEQRPPVESIIKQPEAGQAPVVEIQPSKEIQPRKPEMPVAAPEQPQEPVVTSEEPVISPPVPPVAAPPEEIQLPEGFPPLPIPEQEMFGLSSGLFALMATLGIILQIIGFAYTIFFILCYFLIGRKLQVPNSWIAWIPILNSFWPLIGAAGKPLRWGLLYLLVVPIVGGILGAIFAMVTPVISFLILAIVAIIVFGAYIYLWMLITENLGKNRWLGLLIIIPIVQLVFVAILAFSKSESLTADTYGDLSTA